MKVFLVLLLTLATGYAAAAQIVDRPIKFVQLTAGVTTDTTSTAVKIPAAGYKSFYGNVVGTGAVTQTQAIYGDFDSDAANACTGPTGPVRASALGPSGCTVRHAAR